jgi:hypothetical protein
VTLQPPAMRPRIAAQLLIAHVLSRPSVVPPGRLLARLFGRCSLFPASIGWHPGAPGAATVGRLLATLPAEWTVFHAVPLGKNHADIDHILVGPGGVFTINTPKHGGKRIRVGARAITVAGSTRASLPAVENEAERVAAVLRARMPLVAPVQPVLALVNARPIFFRDRPGPVKVLDARGLLSWLQRLQPVLSDEEIAEAVVILDSPATWRELPGAAG